MSKNEIRTLKLENLIKEAVTLALFEQDQQPMQNAGPVPPPAPPGPPEQNMPPQPQPGAEDQQQQQPLMTIDSMIERLNVIRGGKSFTDPEVYGQLVTYFKKMTPEQNQVIDQYLQDVSKIMVNVRTGNDEGSQPEQAGQPPAQPGGAPQAPISPNAGATGGAAPAGAGATSSPGM